MQGANHGDEHARAVTRGWPAAAGVSGLHPTLRPGRTLAGHFEPGGVQPIPTGSPAVAAGHVPTIGPAGLRASGPAAAHATRSVPAAASAATERPISAPGRHGRVSGPWLPGP